MKKLLLGAALALAASAAPAQAQVTSSPAAQDPDSVRAYWTAERMRTARPKTVGRAGEPKPANGKPGGGTTTTSWSTLAVNWTTDPALKAHGKVYFTDGAFNYVCSGTAVDAQVVWTAGHCVYENGANRAYTNWAFVPAYNSPGAANTKLVATRLYTTTDWATKDGAYGRDLGAAYFATPTFGTTRALNTSGELPLNTRVHSYGYPAEGKFNGQTMYDCDTYISRYDASATPRDYGIPCGMNGGSSGGGWVVGGQVVSVNSYGYQSLKNTMFGPQQDAVAASLFNSAKSGR